MKHLLIRRACTAACVLSLLLGSAPWLVVPEAGQASAQAGGASASDTELAIRHYRRGNTYNNLERYEDALEEYRLSVAADPEMLDSFRNMGNILLALGRENEAIEPLIRFVNLYDGPPDTALRSALANVGRLLREQGDYDRALEFDLRALEADRQNESLVFLTGNAYLNAGETARALQIYEKAVELNPQSAFMHRTLGRMYDEQGDLESALIHYRLAAEIDPGSNFYRELVRTTEERMEWQVAE